MPSFLTQYERNLIKRDFSDFLKSFEVCDIEIHYRVPTNPVTNEVYNVVTADSWVDKFIKPKASQQIILPTNQKVLAWGILRTGDCLFYILDSVDLKTIVNYDTTYIVCNEQKWQPIPIDDKVLLDYLGFRLGNSQVAQVLPCRTKQ